MADARSDLPSPPDGGDRAAKSSSSSSSVVGETRYSIWLSEGEVQALAAGTLPAAVIAICKNLLAPLTRTDDGVTTMIYTEYELGELSREPSVTDAP